jgi:hypothetical protein
LVGLEGGDVMNYTVTLSKVHDDNSELPILGSIHDTRSSLRVFREMCAIGRAKVRDGEWKRWKAERTREDGKYMAVILSGVADGELSVEVG